MTELYNKMQRAKFSDKYVIIDIRDKTKWDKCHIIKSVAGHGHIEQYYIKKKIVIVMTDEIDSKRHRNKMNVLKKSCKDIIVFDYFDIFCDKYPFLCSFNNVKVKGMNSSMMTYPSEIIKNKLYLGNAIHSGNKKILIDLKITHIINVSRLMNNLFENNDKMNIIYYRIPIGDTLKEDIDKYFKLTHEYINKIMNKNKNVRILIHCQHGISRSPSILISYLMKENQWGLKKTMNFIKRKRSINPNKNFIQKLSDWERENQ